MGGHEVAIDFVMPVFNEGANILRALKEIEANVQHRKRVLIVYDFDEDNTLPVVRAHQEQFPDAELVRNDVGRGVVNAVRAGIAQSKAEVVVITMADLSDDLQVVDQMVTMIEEDQYDVVCASRYMKGGKQLGGPWLKRNLARTAGLSLYWLGGLPVHDATNSFRAYRRRVLEAFPIESNAGFAYTLELTVKAHLGGFRVGEVPSTWRDRSAGESRFKLRQWAPTYFKWYLQALLNRPDPKSKQTKNA